MKHILISLLFLTAIAHAEVVDRVLAIVNEDVITQSDLLKYKKALRNNKINDELFAEPTSELLKDDKKVLARMIDEKILDSEVKRNGLEATSDRIDAEVQQIARKNHISTSQLKKALLEQGTNYTEYYAFIKKRLERQAIIQQSITSRVKISDEDVLNYYLLHSKKKDTSAFEYTVSHILIKPGPGAEKRADEVYAKLQDGANFEEVLRRSTDDKDSIAKNGLLGTFKSGDFLKELENALRPLSEGQFSKPVKTKLGYHILKLIKKVAIPSPDFQNKKEEIRGQLMNEAVKNQFRFWLDQKRKETYIRVNS